MHSAVLVVLSSLNSDLDINKNNMEEYIDETLQPFQSMIDNPQEDYRCEYSQEKTREELEKIYIEENETDLVEGKIEEDLFMEWVHSYYGYEYDYETNTFGYYSNPNGKWDWWNIGGRWKDYIKLKNGTYRDCARVKDVDFLGMVEDAIKYKKDIVHMMIEYIGKSNCANETDMKKVREEFLKNHMTEISTYSFLKDGVWDEPDGYNDESRLRWDKKFVKYISELDPEDVLVLVDCHN